jgi:hypothetical protein
MLINLGKRKLNMKLDCSGTSDVCKQAEIKAVDSVKKEFKPVSVMIIRNGKAVDISTVRNYRTVKREVKQ